MMSYDGVVWFSWTKHGALFWKFCNMIFILMVLQMNFYNMFLEDLVDAILLTIKVWQNNFQCSQGLHKKCDWKIQPKNCDHLNMWNAFVAGLSLSDYNPKVENLKWHLNNRRVYFNLLKSKGETNFFYSTLFEAKFKQIEWIDSLG
jgi:hypothetical protein